MQSNGHIKMQGKVDVDEFFLVDLRKEKQAEVRVKKAGSDGN